MNLDRLHITLPWPDKALFPNAKNGKHWGSFQKAKEQARDSGFYAAKEAIGRHSLVMQERMPVKVTFAFPDRRNRDIEGCIGAIKHHVDGIAKALGVDDRIFRPWTLDDCLDKEKKGFVIVEIGQ